jgi:hypothetical protein
MADNLNSQEERIIQLSGLIQDLYTDYNKQIQDIITKLNEIDVESPDALEQIQALRVEYRTARIAFNKATGPLLAEITSLNATLTPEQQAAVASYVQAAKDATTTRFDKTNTDFNNTRENVKLEAENAAAKKNEEIKANAAQTDVQTEQQNKEYEASGGKDDDKGGSTNNVQDPAQRQQAAADAQSAADAQQNNSDTTDTTGGNAALPPATPTTIAGKSGTPAAAKTNPAPRLRKNPLGDLSSYTYQLTLYMITPDAYNAFVMSGRKDINAFQKAFDESIIRINSEIAENNANIATSRSSPTASMGSPPASSSPQSFVTGGGVYVVAQSGGIGASEKRPPGFDKDFYIDDLKISQAINAKSTLTNVNTTKMSFTITEPYGFSFLSKLKFAAEELKKVCKVKNYGDLKNASKQFFVLGIQFLGYDKDGNVVDSKNVPSAEGDPTANAYGLFQRYYDILLTKVNFKIDGRNVVYSVEAANVSTSPFGTKRGVITSSLTVIGNTVYDALKGGSVLTPDPNQSSAETNRLASKSIPPDSGNKIGLLSTLNALEQSMVGNAIEIANEWDVKFIGGAEELIEKARMVSPNDLNKHRWGRNPNVTDTSKSNDGTSTKASTPDPNSRTVAIQNGTMILQAIDTIIKQSSFMEDALTTVNVANEELKLNTNPNPRTVKWYNISAEVQILGWDTKVGDFAYKTTYIIQPYETPVVLSTYIKNTSPYYGPHKRYDYWFTGQNSEILKYEQTFDNTYFTVTLAPTGKDGSQGGDADVATKVQPSNAPKQGGEAGGESIDAQNNYITSLYDPSALAQAKLTILGDPDYLMQTASSSISSVYSKFNGIDGFTINPNGGQTFIEINFNEPNDYNTDTGLMNINEKILFYKYPDSVKDMIKGIAYMVIDVTSTFAKGKFEQLLSCVLATFNSSPKDTGKDANQNDAETNRLASKNATLAAATIGDATNESNAETNKLANKANLLANAAISPATDESGAETNRLNRSSNASAPTVDDGVGISPLTPYTSLASSSTFLDPAQNAQLASINSVGSINNVMDPSQRIAPNQTITVPTKTGQVQDDDAGTATPTVFGRG